MYYVLKKTVASSYFFLGLLFLAWVNLCLGALNEKKNNIPRIIVLCTAALIENDYDARKQEYIHSLNILSKLGFEPYIVESCIEGPSFLDDFSQNVFYAKCNDFKLRNKGVNEIKALRECFNHFEFFDDDIIIKLTGRYYFENDSFINLIRMLPNKDIFVRPWWHLPDKCIFTGCFALRYHHFKAMLYEIDLDVMEKKNISFECLFGKYVAKQKTEKTMHLDKINLIANVYRQGDCILSYW